jgi:hypothetical protein
MVIEKLLALKDLKPGWDNDDALEINHDEIELMIQLVNSIPFEPFVAPMPCGGVQLTWYLGDKYLEIETLPRGTFGILSGCGNYTETNSFEEIHKKLRELYNLL